MQARHHYELAFADFLRQRRIPTIAVDEARRALLPAGAAASTLKSFDFVVSLPGGRNLLIDVKGRALPALATARRPCLQNWVTQADIDALLHWQRLFGPGFAAAFAFLYHAGHQPPDALFHDVFTHRSAWYACRTITLDAYTTRMRPRSTRWHTVHLPAADFDRLARPLADRPEALGPRP